MNTLFLPEGSYRSPPLHFREANRGIGGSVMVHWMALRRDVQYEVPHLSRIDACERESAR